MAFCILRSKEAQEYKTSSQETNHNTDEDVHIRSDTGWYKRVLNALNVEVTKGVPYTHTSNPLCERQNRVVERNLKILMKQERTKDWVRLVPWEVLTMNSQRSYSTGFTPHKLFHGGRPAWFFKTPFAEDFKSPVGDWLEHKHPCHCNVTHQ